MVVVFMLHYQKNTLLEQLRKKELELQREKKMLKIALEAQEAEHKKIARELHDSIGMMLMTLRISISNQDEGPLQELRNLVDETHESIKRISWNLMPATLDNFGVFQSIQEMCHRQVDNKGIQVKCHDIGKSHPLDKDQDIAFHRMVQESIANAVRHSHAASIDVTFAWADTSLCVTIKDDGVGFDFPYQSNKVDGRHGLGLYNLENRANLLGGHVTFAKNNPTGSIVEIRIPISSHEPY